MPEITMTMVWIAAIVLLLIIEGITAGLVTIWFAIGAVAGLVCERLGAPLWLQLAAFLVVSFVMLVLTRPIAQKHLNSKTQPTNADRMIGKECIVTEPINNVAGTGAVSVGGQIWTARGVNDAVVEADSRAVVRRIEGVKLIVEAIIKE